MFLVKLMKKKQVFYRKLSRSATPPSGCVASPSNIGERYIEQRGAAHCLLPCGTYAVLGENLVFQGQYSIFGLSHQEYLVKRYMHGKYKYNEYGINKCEESCLLTKVALFLALFTLNG